MSSHKGGEPFISEPARADVFLLYWTLHTGKRVTPEGQVEKISGGSKYKWMSAVPPPALVKTVAPVATEPAAEDVAGGEQL